MLTLFLLGWVAFSIFASLLVGKSISFGLGTHSDSTQRIDLRSQENIHGPLDMTRVDMGNVPAVTRFGILPSVCADALHAGETWPSGKPNQFR